MNDFTKEELLMLKNGIEYMSDRTSLDEQCIETYNAMTAKLLTMIDNYCEHKEKECIGGWVSKCVNCGKKFGDETQ